MRRIRYGYICTWDPDGPARQCEGRVSLACRTSFPVGPGKSIQKRLRHDVQHPRRARSALHGDYHIACHIVGAPHEGEEMEEETRRKRMRKRRANERWQRHRMEENGEDVDANRIAIYPRARRL